MMDIQSAIKKAKENQEKRGASGFVTHEEFRQVLQAMQTGEDVKGCPDKEPKDPIIAVYYKYRILGEKFTTDNVHERIEPSSRMEFDLYQAIKQYAEQRGVE